MKCPRCQQENPSHAKFCLGCGTRLSDVIITGRSYADLQADIDGLRRELGEAREQQAATSEILRIISSSPTDLQPVFDTIVRNAARVCEAFDAVVVLADGEEFVQRAHHGPIAAVLGARYPLRGTVGGRAILEARIVHVENLAEASDYPAGRELAQRVGYRTTLSVPLLRDGAAIGAIGIRRTEVLPFSDNQIALLQTFADQAVIAIENARLFQELEARNRDLSETLDRQTATGDVLRIIAQSPTELLPVLNAIAASAVRLCAASDAVIERLEGDRFYNAAHAGAQMKGLVGLPLPLTRGFPGGRAVLDRRRVIIDDVHLVAESEYPDSLELLRLNTIRSVAEIPLLSEGKPLGSLAVLRAEVRPFTDAEVALLETFASQAVIAIENVRLFTELQEKNRALTTAHAHTTEALEQQTATSEILRVIAGSPTDLQPVLDALVESASRLCQAADTFILLVEGDQLRVAALHGSVEESARLSNVIHRGWVAGRAVVDARTVHVEDLANAEAEFPLGAQIAVRLGHRTALAMPLFRKGAPIGTLFLRRREVRPFSAKEIALLQTFADQAVIAIENVRLFRELEARNRDLTEALDQQTATSEILRVISSSPTDLQPVMEALVASAAVLCEAQNAQIFRAEDRTMRLVARHGPVRSTLEAGQARSITRGSVSGRTIVDRTMLHIPDLLADVEGEYPDIAPAIRREGIRTTVGVPLLREGVPIGSITAFRTEVRPFTDKQITLLRTFADQAVIAIENVRLFTELETRNREIEDKSRQLEVASQHKSEFLANMSHELRTPLNAVIGFSEVLAERMFGELNEKQDEYVRDIYASGTHLLSLINDILDLSKIEAGRMELDLGTFDLPNVVDTAVLLIRERAGRRGIVLHVEVDERLGEMQGDERKIKQVLLNLLSNAIKFTPEGGRVGVRAAPVDEHVEVAVSDTGVGIAPEDHEAVFEEFRQVGTAEKKAEGTGLGLALARKFIELHGGRIWVRSQVGEGSTFTFTLPVHRGE